jgi:hypothetical protein
VEITDQNGISEESQKAAAITLTFRDGMEVEIDEDYIAVRLTPGDEQTELFPRREVFGHSKGETYVTETETTTPESILLSEGKTPGDC